ncbi:hypothetical protein WL80_03025 [Burkholderia ubonensis]|nr:hypothetical protein WJ69_35485 [Burkholderia ubonensis]KVO11203.1 hypothetical protein WJ73_20055 [Burkholderia ubonensis]KWE98167.1 hypothetical protein WL80_03025 [Burkholderia ubonensis]
MQAAGFNLLTSFLKPVAHQIRGAGYTAFIRLTQSLDISRAQLTAHLLVADERRIADDSIGIRPQGSVTFCGDQSVFGLYMIQGLQNRMFVDLIAMLTKPL